MCSGPRKEGFNRKVHTRENLAVGHDPVANVFVVGIAEDAVRHNDAEFAIARFQELDAALDEEDFRRHGAPKGAVHHPFVVLLAPGVGKVELFENVLAFDLDLGAERRIGHDDSPWCQAR